MGNALAKTSPRKLTKTQLNQLATYTDPAVILEALKKAGWTVKKAIENLTDIANNCDKDSTKLAANKFCWQLVLDCMERSGMMVIATKKMYGEEGEEVTFTGHVLQSVPQGPSDEQTTMEQLTGDDYPPDSEEPENDTKKTKSRKRKTKTTSRGRSTTSSRRGAGKRAKPDGEGGKDSTSSGTTSAGLSDDLHTSKYPEVHIESFKGLAVPPGTNRPGAASGGIPIPDDA